MPQYILNEHELRTLVHEVAGRASVPFMKENRKLVMPTEELTEGCDELLKEKFGIDPLEEPKVMAGMSESVDKEPMGQPMGRPPHAHDECCPHRH